jgi:putative flippase GtrA
VSRNRRDAATASRRREQVGYVLSGGISIGLDMATLWLLHGPLDVALDVATSAGYVVGLAANFGLNRWAVFGTESALHRSAARYLVLVAFNYAVTLAGVLALAEAGLPYLVARGVLAAATVLWNFVAYRRWVFRA